MQHISTSYWTHAGQLRSIREAVVPENKRLDKKSILMNPIGLVTRAPKLHSRHRPSRKTSKIFKKTDLPTFSIAVLSELAEDWTRPLHGRFATAPNAPETQPEPRSVRPMTSTDLR